MGSIRTREIIAGITLSALAVGGGFGISPAGAEPGDRLDGASLEKIISPDQITSGPASACIEQGVHPSGRPVVVGTLMGDLNGPCDTSRVEGVFACLDQTRAGLSDPMLLTSMAECLGGVVVEYETISTDAPSMPGIDTSHGDAYDPGSVSGKPGTACRQRGVNPELADTHPGVGGTISTVEKAIQVGPAVVAVANQQHSQKDYWLYPEKHSKAGDENQYQNNLKTDLAVTSSQIEVPGPTGLGGGAAVIAKASAQWLKENAKGLMLAVYAALDAAKKELQKQQDKLQDKLEQATATTVAPPPTTPPTTPTPAPATTVAPSAGTHGGAVEDRTAEGTTSPCEQGEQFIAQCEEDNWLSSDCQDLKNRLKGCDPTIARTVEGTECAEEEEIVAPTEPPSPTCTENAKPAPGVDPCNRPVPEGDPEPTGPNTNPCDGINPYAYVNPAEGCPGNSDIREAPVVKGPQPEPSDPKLTVGTINAPTACKPSTAPGAPAGLGGAEGLGGDAPSTEPIC